ncbi:MAG TPA: hypothetical protein ENJ18_17095 [Nannocystis exedens]|nr:hypothetical protein [Nannocystis exedens]
MRIFQLFFVCGLSMALSGCFDEIIVSTGVTASSTDSSGTATTATTTMSTVTGMSTGTTTVDIDMTETIGSSTTSTTSTTGSEDVPGICPDLEHHCGGESWQVEPCVDCEKLSAIAECVFGSFESPVVGEVTVVRCDGDCVRDHYLIRGSSQDVVIESKGLDGEGVEVTVLSRTLCKLREPSYFEACISDFQDSCADPSMWVTDCVDFMADECPNTQSLT